MEGKIKVIKISGKPNFDFQEGDNKGYLCYHYEGDEIFRITAESRVISDNIDITDNDIELLRVFKIFINGMGKKYVKTTISTKLS